MIKILRNIRGTSIGRYLPLQECGVHSTYILVHTESSAGDGIVDGWHQPTDSISESEPFTKKLDAEYSQSETGSACDQRHTSQFLGARQVGVPVQVKRECGERREGKRRKRRGKRERRRNYCYTREPWLSPTVCMSILCTEYGVQSMDYRVH